MDKDKQIAEVFAWAEKMREKLEQFASATCAGLHGGDCGECFSCKARKTLALTPPQAYKDWASRMGKMEKALKSIAYPHLGILCSETSQVALKALSDQEGAR